MSANELRRTVAHWKGFKELAHSEAAEQRARDLDALGLNGVRLALVDIPAADHALVDLHFFNSTGLTALEDDIANGVRTSTEVFPITGGQRLLAGTGSGEVRTVGVVDREDARVRIRVEPIGDYSTYTLSVVAPGIDPFFQGIDFRFRPGCFSNCDPEWGRPQAPKADPVIDYLAKDYESFRHMLIAWMTDRVPGWEATSEADLDMVLLELFAVAGDELSDYQDRVVNEAYLGSARKRVSVARHALLMDYHIHQGNQASTWQVLQVRPAQIPLLQNLVVRTDVQDGEDAVVFRATNPPRSLFTLGIALGAVLDAAGPPGDIIDAFAAGGQTLAGAPVIDVVAEGDLWHVTDPAAHRVFVLERVGDRIRVFDPPFHPLLNGIGLHTWTNAVRTLEAGSTSADLRTAGEDEARLLTSLLRNSSVTKLVLQEHLNPDTGALAGLDPTRRQLLDLLPGDAAAEALQDPTDSSWLVRVRWAERDELRRRYCFTVEPDGVLAHDISLFHGNLAYVHQGRLIETTFKAPGESLDPGQCHYAIREGDGAHRSQDAPGDAAAGVVVCGLPEGPLLYRNTVPGGEQRTRSTLRVSVVQSASTDEWDEVSSLVHSDASSEAGDHYVVETDELGRSLIRFGNGTNGMKLPGGAQVECTYQVGSGPDGNVGRDALTVVPAQLEAAIAATWNPFDVTDGRSPEPLAEIVRRVPEAYRTRQLRAVTLSDYVRRAEELDEVAAASARYVWTGSWRGVRVTIDPVGTTELPAAVAARVSAHLEAVRLIGEDLEIRGPRFVPLEIDVSVCIHEDYWPEDIRFFLEQEFSDGYTSDGRLAFFHPDRWTFGQELRASQIIGRAQAIQGLDHVTSVSLRRRNAATPGTPDRITVAPSEIILVRNDRDSMENGSIRFEIGGGRG